MTSFTPSKLGKMDNMDAELIAGKVGLATVGNRSECSQRCKKEKKNNVNSFPEINSKTCMEEIEGGTK